MTSRIIAIFAQESHQNGRFRGWIIGYFEKVVNRRMPDCFGPSKACFGKQSERHKHLSHSVKERSETLQGIYETSQWPRDSRSPIVSQESCHIKYESEYSRECLHDE